MAADAVLRIMCLLYSEPIRNTGVLVSGFVLMFPSMIGGSDNAGLFKSVNLVEDPCLR